MISFRNDYSEGAHPKILAALEQNNLTTTCGYSMDPFCDEARAAIRARFACPAADVHFLVGGTIANTTVIAAALRPWEGVIAATTGHINVHETGAIESSGHKVCAIEATDGKLTPALVREVMRIHCDGKDEHMVLPRMAALAETGWANDRKDYNDFVRRIPALVAVYKAEGYNYAPYLFEGIE